MAEPALFPHQWKERRAYGAEIEEGVLEVGWATHTGAARKGLAALALHEQPFGFTHDMVTALREAAEAWHREMVDAADSMDAPVYEPPHVRAKRDAMLAAIDNIEALLPPRDAV